MLRPKRGYLIASVFIVAFWLLMTALLAGREIARARLDKSDEPTFARRTTALDTWYRVEHSTGKPAGVIHLIAAPGVQNGISGTRSAVTALLRVDPLGLPLGVEFSGHAWTPEQGGAMELTGRLAAAGQEMRVEGKVDNGMLSGTLTLGEGTAFPVSMPMQQGTSLWGVLGAELQLPNLAPGTAYELPMPWSGGYAEVEYLREEIISIENEPVRAKVIEVTTQGMASQLWLDDKDEIVRFDSPFGYRLVKTDMTRAAELKKDWESAAPGEAEALFESILSTMQGEG